jgi:hypothetical protein
MVYTWDSQYPMNTWAAKNYCFVPCTFSHTSIIKALYYMGYYRNQI